MRPRTFHWLIVIGDTPRRLASSACEPKTSLSKVKTSMREVNSLFSTKSNTLFTHKKVNYLFMRTTYGAQLLKQLEELRKDEGLTKRALAKRLGLASPQTYTNWLNRGEVSKSGIGPALQLLQPKVRGSESALDQAQRGEPSSLPAVTRSVTSSWSNLPRAARRDAFQSMAESLTDDELKKFLAAALETLPPAAQLEVVADALRKLQRETPSGKK
jgi:transcriptional regulator with XRE-family HTH domain